MFSCEFCEISKNTFFTEYLSTTASGKLILVNITFSYLVVTPVKSQSEIKQFPAVNAKLLGIKINNSLKFKEHIESLCKKASQKISALSRLASSMNFEQRRLIMSSFVICHFSYFAVVWMFHSRKLNARINRLHERALRVVYRDFDSSFEKLLRRDSCTTLHQRNLQELMTEIFKVKTGIATELMKVVFELIDAAYNLRNQSNCSRSIPCTERHGIEMASSIGPKLWDKAPTEIKNSKSLVEFKV